MSPSSFFVVAVGVQVGVLRLNIVFLWSLRPINSSPYFGRPGHSFRICRVRDMISDRYTMALVSKSTFLHASCCFDTILIKTTSGFRPLWNQRLLWLDFNAGHPVPRRLCKRPVDDDRYHDLFYNRAVVVVAVASPCCCYFDCLLRRLPPLLLLLTGRR